MDENSHKVKTRDRKMFTKKFHGGKLPPRKMPPIPQRKKKKKKKINSRKN